MLLICPWSQRGQGSLHSNESFGLGTGLTNLMSKLTVALRCSNNIHATRLLYMF